MNRPTNVSGIPPHRPRSSDTQARIDRVGHQLAAISATVDRAKLHFAGQDYDGTLRTLEQVARYMKRTREEIRKLERGV